MVTFSVRPICDDDRPLRNGRNAIATTNKHEKRIWTRLAAESLKEYYLSGSEMLNVHEIQAALMAVRIPAEVATLAFCAHVDRLARSELEHYVTSPVTKFRYLRTPNATSKMRRQVQAYRKSDLMTRINTIINEQRKCANAPNAHVLEKVDLAYLEAVQVVFSKVEFRYIEAETDDTAAEVTVV